MPVRIHPSTAVVALATLGACAPMAPQGTTAEGVADVNYELTELRDDQWGLCHDDDLDAALAEVMANPDWNMVGCAAGWAKNGQIVYLTAQGAREEGDPQNFVPDVPYDIHTLQPIASVSKPMTAIALVRLVELGYADLDDTVEEHLGALVAHHPQWVRQATIAQILSHTAGFNDGEILVQLDPNDPGSILDEYDVFYTDVDWAAWDQHTVAQLSADPTWGRRPAVAQIPLVFQPNPTSDPNGDGVYSNIGYLFAGAIIDVIVDRPDFTGFDDYPYADTMERTYEAWVWWVFSGEGSIEDWNLYTPVLRHPWRLYDGAYDHLATGYYSPGHAIGPADNLEEYGWVAPSGSWMLTIGDLTRLGIVIADEEILDQQEGGGFFDPNQHDDWGDMKASYSTARGDAYGLGLTKHYDPLVYGHGGSIEGYVAGVWTLGDTVVAFQCNTSPMDGTEGPNGAHKALHKPIGDILLDAYADDTTEPWCPPEGALPKTVRSFDALDVLSNDYYEGAAAELSALVSRYGLEKAFAMQQSQLAADPAGKLLLEALRREDWERAAECALVYLGDRQGSWTCR